MFCGDILEQAAIIVSPKAGPTYLESFLGKEAFDERDINTVEVDFAVA